MGGRSRIFIVSAAFLVLVICGLTYSLIKQASDAQFEASRALVQSAQERQAEQLKLMGQIQTNGPGVISRAADLQKQLEGESGQLTNTSQQPEIEASIRRVVQEVGKGQDLAIESLDVKRSDPEGSAFRLHIYSLYMIGRPNSLGEVVNRLYALPHLAQVQRVAAASRDNSLRNYKMVIDLALFELKVGEQAKVSDDQALRAFASGLTDLAGVDLTGLEAEVQALRDQETKLNAQRATIIEVARAEQNLAILEKSLAATNELVANCKANRQLLTTHLPTLFARLRGTAIGGAALVVKGDSVTFPDYAGVE